MKLTRRELIRAGAGAALLGGVAGGLEAAGDPMNMATIPSTGERIPCVGIGTNRYRGNPSSDSEMLPFRETLAAFHANGGRVIDTSPNYGNSEAVLGRLLSGMDRRDSVFMATKVDREDRAEGESRMAASAERLGGKIDLMQVHNLRGVDIQLPTLQDWKSEGRFRYIGVTTHRVSQHDEIERVMRNYPLDFIQINYSLADRAAADRLLPLARDRGVAVLVNRPFGNGQLFSAVKGVELPGWAADIDAESWGQVFLKYIISHPAETVPIPGTTKPHHVVDNLGAMHGRLPDPALRAEMEGFLDGRL